MLGVQATAPPVQELTFYVSNGHATVGSLVHTDPQNTPYAQLSLPAGAVASVNGTTLGPDDSVLVTISALSGRYGVDITPAGIAFAAGARPTLTFSYARYGDLSVAAGTRYPDALSYATALDVWHETTLDLWSNAGGSGNTGTDLSTTIGTGGSYVAAAQR